MDFLSKPQWSIPGIGLPRPGIDRVVIASPMSVGYLKKHLPIAALEHASHKVAFTTYNGSHPRFQSIMTVTGTHTTDPWSILAAHEVSLGRYSIVEAEVAFDVPVGSIGEARSTLFSLIAILGKRRHQRGSLRTEHEPDRTPPAGCVSEPSWYFEDRRAGVKIKCYIRHEKLPRLAFGELIVRLEWTLKGKPAIDRDRYLGGNKISHLINADLNSFLARNIRLERVDHVALGKLFRERKTAAHSAGRLDCDHARDRDGGHDQWQDPDYRAWRAAFLVLRSLAHREYAEGRFADWDQALWTCQHSPAQMRGYFRQLMDKKRRPGRRGRPRKHAPQERRPITEYRLRRCFRKIALTKAPPAV